MLTYDLIFMKGFAIFFLKKLNKLQFHVINHPDFGLTHPNWMIFLIF